MLKRHAGLLMPSVMIVKQTYSSDSALVNFNLHGNTTNANMVSVKNASRNLVKFSVSLEHIINSMKNSIIQEADTGMDIYLINSKTFDSVYRQEITTKHSITNEQL